MEETMTTYEEIENTEVEEINEPEESNNGSLGKLILGIGAVVAAGVAVAHFTKNKRREYQIKKLEKAGYVISKPEEADENEEVEYIDED